MTVLLDLCYFNDCEILLIGIRICSEKWNHVQTYSQNKFSCMVRR